MSDYAALLSRLPVKSSAAALLGPASLVREGTVVLARTARNWELTLANLAGRELENGHGTPMPTAAAAAVRTAAESTERGPARPDPAPGSDTLDPDEAPVDGWAEMSTTDARGAVSDLSTEALSTLLAYEQSHGRRLQYMQLLEQRIADSGAASQKR